MIGLCGLLLGTCLVSGVGAAPPSDGDEKGAVKSLGATNVTLFDNFNGGAVSNGPTALTTFTLQSVTTISLIRTYHWNNARGKAPGTIWLQGADGKKYGPWQATGIEGQGGVKGAFWEVKPSVVLAAGKYTILDSSTESWSCNAQSLKQGFARVEGMIYRR